MVGEIEKAQFAPACLTITVLSAIVITPLRAAALGFASTVKLTLVPGRPPGVFGIDVDPGHVGGREIGLA